MDDSNESSLLGLQKRIRDDSDSKSESNTDDKHANIHTRTQQQSEDIVTVNSDQDS